jgi:hypothetical protein
MTETQKPTGLALMREPFEANHISKLPKPTRRQTDDVKADFKKGIRCQLCGGWHHKDVVHLDYVGHAALTDRLLDCDPEWNWEPVSFNDQGLPAIDNNGGMWIRLTVCGQSRLGYGDAEGKKGGNAVKELIGDALRNAAMRFGAALDLWHKGDLHGDEEPEVVAKAETKQEPVKTPSDIRDELKAGLQKQTTAKALETVWDHHKFIASSKALPEPMQNEVKAVYTEMRTKLEGKT